MQRNFPEVLFCMCGSGLCFCSSQTPSQETMILQTRYSEHECNVGHHSLQQQTQMGEGWGVPISPTVFIASGTTWPLLHYQYTHKYAPMPGERFAQRNVWTPAPEICGLGVRDYKEETLWEKGLLMFVSKISILGCSKIGWSTFNCQSCLFCPINVSSWTS